MGACTSKDHGGEHENSGHLQETFDLVKAKNDFEERWSKNVENTACLEDFDQVKFLGPGTFGPVMIVEHRENKKLHNMRVMNKEKIVKLKFAGFIQNEKRILDSINFPFIKNLEYHFEDNSSVYMVYEHDADATDACFHPRYGRHGKFSEDRTRFYAAQIVLTLEYLHHLDIIYRNLSIENLMIDSQGYLKLACFQYAKQMAGQTRTWSLCGSPEFLAPEMILGNGYGKAVDWWALGVLLYEMVADQVPFYADHPIQIYEKIVSGRIDFPSHFSRDLKHLTGNLLRVNPHKRFGSGENGVNDLKSHHWFSSTDWMAVYQKRIQAPYVPKRKDLML